jgi:parallel beta-helix repeat protein
MQRCRIFGSETHDARMIPAVLFVVFLFCVIGTIPAASAAVFMYPGAGNGTIQDMINQTTNGDSLFLFPGIYHENLIIDRAIVFGALDTASPPEIYTDESRPGVTLAADGVTLNGLNISGTAPVGLVVQSGNNRISDIVISGFDHGIELKGATNNIFSGNTVTGNSIGVLMDRSSRSNTFLLNRFDNLAADISGQPVENLWYSGGQDYSFNGSSFSGPLGNFWKAYSGTDTDGNGVGDTPYIVSGSTTGPSGTSEVLDRAPLAALPGSYTLVVKNTSVVNTTLRGDLSRPPDLAADRQQVQQQQPPGQTLPGADSAILQGQYPADSLSSLPGKTTTPPGGIEMLPRILMDYWWVIGIVIVISLVGGIIFERSRRRTHLPLPVELYQTRPPANATLVQGPGSAGGVIAGEWRDQPYYGARLPSALEKKYPDAEYLGEGGVGRVFRAWDTTMNRSVAVKIPIRFDEVTGTQFTKELHIWQGLHNKNIVEIYAANVFPMPYIEMEYVGSSLANLKFPLSMDRAVRIITGVMEGLRYAHERGIVHRDIKPENILLTDDDVPKITDWGLAKALSDTRQTGLISFSLNYAAPEQLAPNIYGEAGEWTDIYQAGVLFYEMVTGRLPFSGTGMGEVTQAILHNTPHPLDLSGPDAAAIGVIIGRCLQKQPKDRYASAAEVLDDLRRLSG